jgi:polysaccharide pyruvyl transferase
MYVAVTCFLELVARRKREMNEPEFRRLDGRADSRARGGGRQPIVASFGAYDRFNYGDLLFPWVLNAAADALGYPPLKHASLRRWDGGEVPLESITEILGTNSMAPRSLVLGGGEICGATWGSAAASVLPIPADLALLLLRRVSPTMFNLAGKALLGGKWANPYIPDAAHLPETALVANSIGASSLAQVADPIRGAALAALSRAAYLSVRDRRGQTVLAQAGVHAVLAPDSVAALSRLYRPQTADGASRLVVQASRAWLRHNGEMLARTILAVANRFDSILLLPIGLAGGHGDLHGLTRLQRRLGRLGLRAVSVMEPGSVWQIADQIANARVFVGTSLHGAITSLAYATPFVPLHGISKLDAYLETWATDSRRHAMHPGAVDGAIRAALGSSQDEREVLGEALAVDSWRNMERVLRVAYRAQG